MCFINIQTAINCLKTGKIVAIPTETVYGLAADGTSDKAVASIYTHKQRPQFNPLIMHVPSIEAITWAEISTLARKLMQIFWYEKAAPISFVLPLKKNHNLSLLALSGLETVAVRRPNHKIALELLAQLDFPLAAPSANRSNSISPTSAQLVIESLGEDINVLDGGFCEVGLESTIVSLVNNKIELLRFGGVTIEELQEYGEVLIANKETAIKAPGMLKKHYAPKHELHINVVKKDLEMLLIGFGDVECDYNLSKSGDLIEAARNLFEYMNKADKQTKKLIGVTPIPNYGLGAAINDRLIRASSR